MKTAPDGLFYHPEGATADAVLKRMAKGTTNYNFDDPFAPAIDATCNEIRRLERQVFEAELRVKRLKSELERAKQRRADQDAALERFAETGEIEPVLLPAVELLAQAEVAKAADEIKKDLDFTLPEELEQQGWVQHGKPRVTEREIIVVIRKARTDAAERVEQVEKRIKETVGIALQPFRLDGSRFRSGLRDRIAARPQQPREPPDD